MDVGGGGEVLHHVAEGLVERELRVVLATGDAAEQHLADLRDDVCIGDGAGLARLQEFGRGRQRRAAAVRDVAARDHQRLVDLDRAGEARTDGIDVRAGTQPRVAQHRRRGTGGRADDVGLSRRLGGLGDRDHGITTGAGEPHRERRRAAGVAPPDHDSLEMPHQPQGVEMRLGLGARAEDRQHPRIAARQRIGRDRAGAGGADPRDLVRIGEAQRLAAVALEQQHAAAVARAARPLRVVEHAQHLGAEAGARRRDAGHQREQLAGLERGDAAQRLFAALGAEPGHRLADRRDAAGPVEPARDLLRSVDGDRAQELPPRRAAPPRCRSVPVGDERAQVGAERARAGVDRIRHVAAGIFAHPGARRRPA